MSDDREKQKKAFKFLLEKCNTQQFFNEEELQAVTGWADKSFKTYFSKQFKDLLVPGKEGQYRVSFVFRRFGTWPKFRDNIVSQKRRFIKVYDKKVHEHVVMFEFFMPLRNEEFLRDALDGLFYKDSLQFRLKALDRDELREQIPALANEAEDRYIERLCDWLARKFIGYSINHTSGRFRSGALKTRQEAAQDAAAKTEKYLVDETTAIVRFIFPCIDENTLGELGQVEAGQSERMLKDAMRIRWFFHQLFVESVLEVVSGEDEIWVMETGLCNQLHIYSLSEKE